VLYFISADLYDDILDIFDIVVELQKGTEKK